MLTARTRPPHPPMPTGLLPASAHVPPCGGGFALVHRPAEEHYLMEKQKNEYWRRSGAKPWAGSFRQRPVLCRMFKSFAHALVRVSD